MTSPGGLTDALSSLAAARGVLTTYVEHGGARRDATPDAVIAVLEALGEDRASTDPAAALRDLRARDSSEILSPVTVLESGAVGRLEVAVSRSDCALECELELEDGEVLTWGIHAEELEPLAPGGPRGVHRMLLDLPGDLEAGYHSLRVRTAHGEGRSHLLCRPAGGARGRFDDSWRAVGIVAPLFTLHSARSWGCGDLSDLDALGEFAASSGASVVATLPLLAGFGPDPFEVSPYLPVSRQHWHERWIDVDAVGALARSDVASALAAASRRELRAAAADDHPFVDGARSHAAKRAVLEALVSELRDSGAHELADLGAFLADRPGVVDFALFRAAGERHGLEWRRWPARLRDGQLEAGDVDPAAVLYHEFAQWVAHTQVTAVAERCERRGQVLSLDLPLGVHPQGYDVWRHPTQFVEGVSVGAPPDRFFPRGQRWGFPPPLPGAVRHDGHAVFRAALAHHLNVASMLRIDHLIGMQRLFWIPDGAEPADGVYVESALEEMLAVVAIEAQRHRATIVGEDLGTVDAAVREAMARDGIRRTFAVELFVEPSGPDPIATPPPGSVASFATHDLPTFKGWWLGRDIEERVVLGQVDGATGETMRAARRSERQRLAMLAPDDAAAAPDGAPPGEVLGAVLERLARSDAGLVMTQLDDLVGELDAVNLPGTSVERRNWQRRTAEPLEQIAADDGVRDALLALEPFRAGLAEHHSERGGRRVETQFGITRFGALDDHLFCEGRHARLYNRLGAHEMAVEGRMGTYFAVWAPNATWVEVVGDFNEWDGRQHPLERREGTGVWEGFVPGVRQEERYKFRLESSIDGRVVDKADPFARRAELAPLTASITAEHRHVWTDGEWMRRRAALHELGEPMSVYEVHLGSWRRVPEDQGRMLGYRELAPKLIEHVTAMGFTHVELLPIMEHPFFASWGYHVTGFFAPTSRYGSPDDFAAFVDELHRAGIGVLLDWVPAHFPADAFALASFDGTHLFEHADPRQGVHPDWHSLIFNYGRNEVRSFLLSAACFWLDRFHVDGLRFDAVASMLYLDYSRGPGEWVPNRDGGPENLDAIEFITTCNEEIHRAFPGVVTVAEESTSWPGVTAPVSKGGLGFDYKWDLGWMHDTLDYLAKDPVHRKWHHDQLTFRSLYATSEQFMLALSHDEVVHGKGSLLGRMPGDRWQRFANLRLLYGYMLAQPGKKLLFMGDEFGQEAEWAHETSLDWHLYEQPEHRGIAALVTRINALYRTERALHSDDLGDRGFAWIDGDDREQSVVCVERHDGRGAHLVIVLNATPEPRHGYAVGMPAAGSWTIRLNSDAVAFGGSGYPLSPEVSTEPEPWHGRAQRASLVLPPLGFVIYSRAG